MSSITFLDWLWFVGSIGVGFYLAFRFAEKIEDYPLGFQRTVIAGLTGILALLTLIVAMLVRGYI